MYVRPKKEDRDYALSLVVIDEDDITQTKEYYPKTYADAVYLGEKLLGNNALDHIKDRDELLHPSEHELMLLRTSPENGGLVKLDSNGHLKLEHTNPISVALYYDYANVPELLSQSTFTLPDDYGRLVMVRDAVSDYRSRGQHRWVLYRYIGPSKNNISSYQIIISEIDVDLVFEWSQFTSEMKSTVEEIDATVRSRHTHDNKHIIDKFDIDQDGNLTYKSNKVIFRGQNKSIVIGKENEEVYLLEGDMGMQVSKVRERDLDTHVHTVDDDMRIEPIIYLRGNCSNRYRNDTGLVNGPKLDTLFMTKADNFFEGCINLKSIDWYEFQNVTSANNFAKDCRSLTRFPELDMRSLESAIAFLSGSGISRFTDLAGIRLNDVSSFFNNCISLKVINSINLPNAINIETLFYNCVALEYLPEYINIPKVIYAQAAFFACRSLTKIGKVISPKMKIADRMFANCSKLVSVEEIDFTSCTSANDIFTGCTELKYIGIKPYTLKVDISFFNTKLSLISLRKIISELPAVTNKTITINYTEAASQLTNEEIANARVKGWNIIR